MLSTFKWPIGRWLVAGVAVLVVISLLSSSKTSSAGTIVLLLVVAFVGYRVVHRRQLATQAHQRSEQLAAEQARVEAERKRAAEEQRKQQLILSQRLDHLLTLTPLAFEQTVADILRHTGFHDVVVVGGSGDLSADITCLDEAGLQTIVQCKQYLPSHKVSSPEVQQFIGMAIHHHGAKRMLYVTTSTFSRPAADLCRHHSVEMIDGEAITRRAASVQT